MPVVGKRGRDFEKVVALMSWWKFRLGDGANMIDKGDGIREWKDEFDRVMKRVDEAALRYLGCRINLVC